MMDTILNLGLNDEAVEGLKRQTGNGRFAFDSYRRFIQMFGNVVLEIPKDAFEHEFDGGQGSARRASSTPTSTRTRCASVVERYKEVVKRPTGKPFPQDPHEQLRDGARRRVPLVDEPARDRIPPHSTTSAIPSARPSTSA